MSLLQNPFGVFARASDENGIARTVHGLPGPAVRKSKGEMRILSIDEPRMFA